MTQLTPLSALLLTSVLAATATAAPQLTLYTTNWQQYYDKNSQYKGYEYDGAYQNHRPYAKLAYVRNPAMIKQFNQADVVAYSFMQVWNNQDPAFATYNIPDEWNGVMHFSDLWGELPYEASWAAQLPPETQDFIDFCNASGSGTCSAVQLNGNTGQQQLFNYTDGAGVGQLNSFGAFINSAKYNSKVKRIIAIGGANTPDNKSVSTHTFNAIFANQEKFLTQFKSWMDHFTHLKGVDYDFEPPIDLATGSHLTPDARTTSDYQKLFALVKASREKLGADAYISVTITVNLEYIKVINRSIEGGWFTEIAKYADSINLMTYDFHGPWGHDADPYTTHHAYLKQPDTEKKNTFGINYAAIKVAETVLDYGLPANKLQIGLAAYGRGFAGVPAGGNPELPGFEQSWTGPSLFGKDYTLQNGLVPYKSIDKLINNLGYQSFNIMANNAQQEAFVTGSYIYSESAQQFVGYQSPEQVRNVCQYIKDKGLQGAILWSADTDLPANDPRSLVASYRAACS